MRLVTFVWTCGQIVGVGNDYLLLAISFGIGLSDFNEWRLRVFGTNFALNSIYHFLGSVPVDLSPLIADRLNLHRLLRLLKGRRSCKRSRNRRENPLPKPPTQSFLSFIACCNHVMKTLFLCDLVLFIYSFHTVIGINRGCKNRVHFLCSSSESNWGYPTQISAWL